MNAGTLVLGGLLVLLVCGAVSSGMKAKKEKENKKD